MSGQPISPGLFGVDLRFSLDYLLGDDCVRAIGGGLHSAAMRGVRMGTPGQPYQEDVEQRDKATELAETLSLGSIEHQFYRSLASTAESRIKWEADRDALLDDRRTW